MHVCVCKSERERRRQEGDQSRGLNFVKPESKVSSLRHWIQFMHLLTHSRLAASHYCLLYIRTTRPAGLVQLRMELICQALAEPAHFLRMCLRHIWKTGIKLAPSSFNDLVITSFLPPSLPQRLCMCIYTERKPVWSKVNHLFIEASS